MTALGSRRDTIDPRGHVTRRGSSVCAGAFRYPSGRSVNSAWHRSAVCQATGESTQPERWGLPFLHLPRGQTTHAWRTRPQSPLPPGAGERAAPATGVRGVLRPTRIVNGRLPSADARPNGYRRSSRVRAYPTRSARRAGDPARPRPDGKQTSPVGDSCLPITRWLPTNDGCPRHARPTHRACVLSAPAPARTESLPCTRLRRSG